MTLSAPSSPDEIRTLSTVIVVVSVMSVVGAGWIILSFIVSALTPRGEKMYLCA